MAQPRGKYTDEYRKECADYVISAKKTVPEAAKELGINYKTLSRWVADRRRELSGEEPQTDDADPKLRAAQKRIRELEQENAFLKKAAAFFAKDQA